MASGRSRFTVPPACWMLLSLAAKSSRVSPVSRFRMPLMVSMSAAPKAAAMKLLRCRSVVSLSYLDLMSSITSTASRWDWSLLKNLTPVAFCASLRYLSLVNTRRVLSARVARRSAFGSKADRVSTRANV
ncbi:hypothetical protein D9M68_589970 [compost metagenome]